MKILLRTAFISIFINTVQSSYCYWNTGCPYKYLSTETPYNSVRGDIRDSVVKLKGCEPVSIWGLFRHGKRQPNSHVGHMIKEAIFIRNYVISSFEKGRSSLCAQDVENLRNWEYSESFFDETEDITEEGRKEMIGLGKRINEAFPVLFKSIEKGSYTFRSTRGPWTEESIKYFVKGLSNNSSIIEEAKIIADVMDTCEKFRMSKENVKENMIKKTEIEKYLSGSDYLATKDRIQRRSGIEYVLSDENITALYDLCRYTWSALDDKVSPWCALFTKDDLQVLEYINDLEHYYENGYGTPANEVIGRVTLANLLQSFENVTKSKGKVIVAYVTHVTMLNQIYIALGLFKDSEPLTGTKRNHERKWRTSKISAFSANLIAVLSRCDKKDSDDYNIVFYLNEEPMRSICEEGVCSWREFDTKLRPFINTTIDFCKLQNDSF